MPLPNYPNNFSLYYKQNHQINCLHQNVANVEKKLLETQEELKKSRQITEIYHKLFTLMPIVNNRQENKNDENLVNLKFMVENIKDYAIFIMDANGYIATWNAGAQRIKGYNAEEIIGKHFSCFYPEEDQQNGKPLKELEIATAEGSYIEEGIRIRKDGSSFWASVTITAFYQENGKLWGFGKVTKEITQQKEAELALEKSEANLRDETLKLEQALEQLKKTQSELIQTEKMSSLGLLVAGVAHEINNPVNFIYGNLTCANDYIEDLLKLIQVYNSCYPGYHPQIEAIEAEIDLQFITKDLPKLLNSMKVGASRIREIVSSLRVFSRMDEAEMKEVNIHDGIDSTLLILQNLFKSKGENSEIKVLKEYGSLPLIECYAGELNQVFMNIIVNAIDSLKEASLRNKILQPIIHIQTTITDANQVIISFRDNGLGISDSIKNKIFQPFFTTKIVGKGTGLGLSISYQIINDKHNGSLECFSEVGQGTEFIIKIPHRQNNRVHA
jgi:two-component system, NtrC family, sensor kinase